MVGFFSKVVDVAPRLVVCERVVIVVSVVGVFCARLVIFPSMLVVFCGGWMVVAALVL